MQRIRVLFIYNVMRPRDSVGGAGEGLRLLVRDLDPREFSPSVCGICPSERMIEFARSNTITATRLPTPFAMKPYQRLLKLRGGGCVIKYLLRGKLTHVLRRIHPHIVHFNLLEKWDAFDLRLAKKFGAATIGHVRALGSQFTFRPQDVEACDAIICVSDCVLEAIKSLSSTVNALRIYNGVDLPRYKTDCPPSEARQFLRIPTHPDRLIVSVAALEPRKGHDAAIRALAKIRNAGVDAILGIVGAARRVVSRTERQRLEEIARNVGVENFVYFTGKVEQMSKAYAAADLVYALSHDGEAFGRVPIEAAAAGRPVIATRIGATIEIVKDGKTGLLTKPGDIDDIAAKSISVFENSDLYMNLVRQSMEHAEQHFSGDRCTREVENVYRSLIGRS